MDGRLMYALLGVLALMDGWLDIRLRSAPGAGVLGGLNIDVFISRLSTVWWLESSWSLILSSHLMSLSGNNGTRVKGVREYDRDSPE